MEVGTLRRVLRNPALLPAAAATRLRRFVVSSHLKADVERASRRLAGAASARGLFVDCGSNVGQGFTYFRTHFRPHAYDYLLIEPNPNCVRQLRALVATDDGTIEIVEAAASDRNGQTRLFGLTDATGGATSLGGSIVLDHPSATSAPDGQQPISVRTVSLSDLIEEKSRVYPAIVMKMDIEGAEYAVLEDLLRSQASRHLASLYVEFHSVYMQKPIRAVYAARERAIRRRFRAAGIPLRTWI